MTAGSEFQEIQKKIEESQDLAEGRQNLNQITLEPAENVQASREIQEAEDVQKAFEEAVGDASITQKGGGQQTETHAEESIEEVIERQPEVADEVVLGVADSQDTSEPSGSQEDSPAEDNRFTSPAQKVTDSRQVRTDAANEALQEASERAANAQEDISQAAGELEEMGASDLPGSQDRSGEEDLEDAARNTEGIRDSGLLELLIEIAEQDNNPELEQIIRQTYSDGSDPIDLTALLDNIANDPNLDKAYFLGKLAELNESAQAVGDALESLSEDSEEIANYFEDHASDQGEDYKGSTDYHGSQESLPFTEFSDGQPIDPTGMSEAEAAAQASRVEVPHLEGSLENQSLGVKGSLEQIGDDAQLEDIDMQNALQAQQQLLAGLANLAKTLEDGATSVIHKMEGGEGDTDQTPSEGDAVPDGTEDTGTNLKEGLTEIQTYGSGSILVGIAKGELPDVPRNDPPDKERKLSPTDEEDK